VFILRFNGGANDAPLVTAPLSQGVAKNSGVSFNRSNGNLIAISDVDGYRPLVSLSVGNGFVSLSRTTGLILTAGTGERDTLLTFSGTIADINAALADAHYEPNVDFFGADSIVITVSDLGQSGAGGAMSATHTIAITIAPSPTSWAFGGWGSGVWGGGP
jgi:hypothetical protein